MRKPYGQHFLFDTSILNRIIDCSNVSVEDTVVEIGPGLGTLTRLLAKRAKKVIAIEIDRKLTEKIKQSLSNLSNVELVTANALKFPYENIEGTFKIVSNIPYYITTPLLFKLLKFRDKIPCMTLLMQKEVAQRIIANPGNKDYGVLSITSQLYTEPELKFSIPKGAFSPPPKVDSAVLYFTVFSAPRYKTKDEELLIKVVKRAFSQRRKTISNSLSTFKGIMEALKKSGVNPKARPETLSIMDFIRIANNLKDKIS
jgi:16S rRNA (adenine1518-N6/adenine1519-N6)-dimethyltransferase